MQSTMMDRPLSLALLVEYGMEHFGDRSVSVSTGDGQVRRTDFATVGLRAGRLAAALQALGVRGGDRVATFMWNSQEHLEAYFAVPGMGAVLHPLNVRLAGDDIEWIVKHAEDQVVLVDADLWPRLSGLMDRLVGVRHVVVAGPAGAGTPVGRVGDCTVHSYEELLAAQATPLPWVVLDDERSAAAMCYTSGTTGSPKGVVYSHRSMVLHAMSLCMTNVFGLSAADTVLPIVPMFHANGWGQPYAALMVGTNVVLPDRFSDGEVLAELIATEQVTFSGGIPTIWQSVLDAAKRHERDLSCLRMLNCGGAVVPPQLLEEWEERFGVEMTQGWGMTETSPLGSLTQPVRGLPDAERRRRIQSQGRFLPLVERRIVDDAGAVLPHDGVSAGELQVRGPYVTGSYYGINPRDAFDDGWLRTGDVVTIDASQHLTLHDRSKDVIKSGGEWISPKALEAQLNALEQVADVAVIGVPDVRWQERPVAVVVAAAAPLDLARLEDHLGQTFASWQVPRLWAQVAALPLTSVGKVDKVELRRRYAAGELEVEAVER